MHVLHGIAVSPGVAIGEALVLDNEGFRLPHRFVEREMVDHELTRFRTAVENVAVEISTNRDAVSIELGEQYGAIFEAHLQMLRDPQLGGEIEGIIRADCCAAEHAVSRVLRRYAKIFQNLQHSYLAERAADIFDIEKRLLRSLLGVRREELSNLTSPVVVLAHDLTPGETAQLNRKLVLGLVTEAGSSGSHTAIMAAALGIPAVVGVGRFLTDVSGGERVIVDGDHGEAVIAPNDVTLTRYDRMIEQQIHHVERLATLRELPSETIDGCSVKILSNIEFPHEVSACLREGSDGVGLYRTEFLYLGAIKEPTEEDQYEAYKQVVEEMHGKPVIIRTLDLGADKLTNVAHLDAPPDEKNPFLGLRSIRLSLRNLQLFRMQLRAVLRASVFGDARLMFPLISTVAELRQAKMILQDVAEDLEEAGLPFRRDIPIGMMVEVPAAVVMIERFVREVDFFSVGTNDLIQYTLAVDRGNKDVASLYSASDPAILRQIKTVVDASGEAAIPVNVCGQMSGNPIYTMPLLGMGLRQLSVPAAAHAEIKKVVRSVTLAQCKEVAAKALQLDHAREVTRYLQGELQRVLPDVDPV